MLTKKTAFLMLTGLWLSAVASLSFAALPAGSQLDLKVLVIGPADDPSTAVNEGVYVDAAKAILDRLGVPYDVASYNPTTYQQWVTSNGASGTPPTPLPPLEDAATNHGHYQGVIFALSDWRMNPYYPATWAGQTPDAKDLEAYLYKYNVRVASLYASPSQTGCLGLSGSGVSVGTTPANTLLTAAGKTALPYLKAGTSTTLPLPLKNTFLYVTPALPATGTYLGIDYLPPGTTVTPWITYNSGPIASMCQFTNATGATRQLLALTFANAPYLTHSMALSYGIVDWVTKGIYLGQRHVYMDPQADDLFLPDDEYPYTVLNDGTLADFREYTKSLLGLPNNFGQKVTCDTTNGFSLSPPGTALNTATGSPCEYRITGAEFTNLVNWQNNARGNSWGGARTINNRTINTANANGTDGLRLSHAYNGALATIAAADQPCGTLCELAWPGDTLTTAVNNDSSEFKWINHTYDHENLGDPISGWPNMLYTATGTCPNSVLDAYTELCWNHTIKQVLGLGKYDKQAIVTPEYSGLYNRDFLEAAAVFGITYLATDVSRPTPPVGSSGCLPSQGTLPGPNVGKYNCEANTTDRIVGKNVPGTPRLLYEVPRYPVALYYLVTTPQEWTDLFNFFYGANGVLSAPSVPPFVDASGNRRNLTYAEIVEYVSDTLLGYLLSYDLRPWMFHQANFRQYSGTTCLLCDLLAETLTKYNAWYQNQPIRSPRLKAEGDLMKQRMVYNAMGVTGVLTVQANGTSTINLTAVGSNVSSLTNPADAATVVVPVTGVSCTAPTTPGCGTTPGTGSANNPETYGSGAAAKTISYISLTSAGGYQVSNIPAPTW